MTVGCSTASLDNFDPTPPVLTPAIAPTRARSTLVAIAQRALCCMNDAHPIAPEYPRTLPQPLSEARRGRPAMGRPLAVLLHRSSRPWWPAVPAVPVVCIRRHTRGVVLAGLPCAAAQPVGTVRNVTWCLAFRNQDKVCAAPQQLGLLALVVGSGLCRLDHSGLLGTPTVKS